VIFSGSFLPLLKKESSTMRVGENFCPGILHAVQAKDGLLTRIRVPGGMIVPGQLSAVAELSTAFSDGHVEITSRSNLQMRAIQNKNLSCLAQGLDSAGFLPSPNHDRVRNVVTNPFAGLGFDEILDSRSFVRELDSCIIGDPGMANLPPKFSFAIDSGGSWFSHENDDLALRVITVDDSHLFSLSIGGIFSGFGVTVDKAVDCLLKTAQLFLYIAKKFDVPPRARKIASMPEAMNYLLKELSHFLVDCPSSNDYKSVAEVPVGVYLTKKAGFVNLVPLVPLGRLASAQTQCIASIATEWDGDLRLAPWRGIIIGSIPECAIRRVAARLQSVGLSLDHRSGYGGVFVCAGTGCNASLADVRNDASLLARMLSAHARKPGWTVNISGCEKQCAMRNGATAELVATSSGYDLRINGRFIAPNCSRESAIDAVVACRYEVRSEVSSR
jgi:precorrin-3B synthase